MLAMLLVGGCQAAPSAGGDRPVVVKPTPAAPVKAAPTMPAGASVQPGPEDRVVARVDGVVVRQSSLDSVLLEAYGLDVLMKVVQLEMARAEASNLGAVVTDADVAAEREATMRQVFPELDDQAADATLSVEERAARQRDLLDQLLKQQRVSEAEFELVMRTNANLRAIIRPQVKAKITEKDLQDAFNAFYGERARVRHIALANLQEVTDAKARLAAGESFEAVARAMSRVAATSQFGGALTPFSRSAPGMSAAFVDAAFSLQPGQVSDPVQSEGFFHLIKLEEKIAPRVVKFEDVKDAVRVDLESRAEQAAMAVLRQELGRRALRNLRIEQPAMKKQFDARVQDANGRPADRDAVRRAIESDANQTPAPTTKP
jgi:parvulin-like peptidyl-prolyl isomerase